MNSCLLIMSSQYVILGNRSLDQWKVTELREELKRRKLTIKGLKEDLVKRLDEAVRTELENAKGITDTSLNEIDLSFLPPEQASTGSVVSEVVEDLSALGSSGMQDGDHEFETDGGEGLLAEGEVMVVDTGEETNIIGHEELKTAQSIVVDSATVISETTKIVASLSDSHVVSQGVVTDVDPAGLSHDSAEPHPENSTPELSDPNLHLDQPDASGRTLIPPTGQSLQQSESQNEVMNSTVHLENDDAKIVQPEHIVSPLKYQVSGVDHPDLESHVISDSVSTESVSIIEKTEVQVDVITDNVNLELNVDREMVHSPPSSFEPDVVDTQLMEIEEPHDVKVSLTSNAENFDSLKNFVSDDLEPEKLSLDRVSDDSLEEDVLEIKENDFKYDSIQTMDIAEKNELLPAEEDVIIDVDGKSVTSNVTKDDDTMIATSASVKRKLNRNDKEVVGNNETSKRPRRWNVEGLKGSDAQSGTLDVPTFRTPNNFVNDSQVIPGRLNRSDSGIGESPKERLVPPSSRSLSNCLRIDRFLRPFTLKAVQELVGKTGTVTSFWMDHIKTHCYVSYSSVEDAIETRNAVYNLQWPPNGGRTLVAEFVESDEVKARVDAPLASSTTPSGSAAANFSTAQTRMHSQPSPRQQIQRKELPPPPFPPPPPFSCVPPVKERPHLTREPQPREQQLQAREQLILPPPPLVEKIELPIVTLDDLFRKTIATPRIYYLPLSDEEVAAKLKAQGTNA